MWKWSLALRECGGLVKVFDVLADVGERGLEDGFAGKVLSELTKNPWVADAVAPDHQSCGVCLVEHALAFGDGGDVAICEDGDAQALDGAGDVFVVDLAAVGFFDGACVEAEEVDLVLVDEVEDGLEVPVVFEADPHLDGEGAANGLAEAAEDGVDLFRLAEEAAADVLFINFGGRAAHVEIDAGDGECLLLDAADGPLEVGQALADHLRKDWAASLVVPD